MVSMWTLDELVGRVAAVLARSDVRAPNGRVTGLPDARMIRWYTTIGLVDRPTMRGRTAYYGERHLLQLVAVKRLQQEGLALAQVQHRLLGATDETLRDLAAVSPEETRAEPEPAKPAPGPDRVHGVRVGGLTLLLEHPPREEDLADIAAAAAPLLHTLATKGLLGREAE
jgi:DNA-binding transcriptional MerR regulator